MVVTSPGDQDGCSLPETIAEGKGVSARNGASNVDRGWSQSRPYTAICTALALGEL